MEHILLKKTLNGNRNTCCNCGWIHYASLRKSSAIQWINTDTRNAFLAPVWLCLRLQTVTDLYMAHMHTICFWLCFFPFTSSSANRNDILINASLPDVTIHMDAKELTMHHFSLSYSVRLPIHRVLFQHPHNGNYWTIHLLWFEYAVQPTIISLEISYNAVIQTL